MHCYGLANHPTLNEQGDTVLAKKMINKRHFFIENLGLGQKSHPLPKTRPWPNSLF
jgi:hypothetical protein